MIIENHNITRVRDKHTENLSKKIIININLTEDHQNYSIHEAKIY